MPRRWRFQFGPRTLLILIVVVAVACGWPHFLRRYRVHQLATFAGRDFRKMDAADRKRMSGLMASLIPVTGRTLPDGWPGTDLAFRYVCRPQCANPFLIVFELSELDEILFMVPGESRPRVVMLDSSGHEVYRTEFSTGWRLIMEDASFHEDEPGFPYLKIETRPSLGGSDLRWQYYALVGSRLELVRIEDSQHRVLPLMDQARLGPDFVSPKIDEWNRLISTSDRLNLLRALGTLPTDDPVWRTRAEVRSRVAELTHSKDRWVSEAAAAYLTFLETHTSWLGPRR